MTLSKGSACKVYKNALAKSCVTITQSGNRRTFVINWLASWVSRMNQILSCDWLPERARWRYPPAVFRKKNLPESHIINPLLSKLVRSRWLDIGLWISTLSLSVNMQKTNLASRSVNVPCTYRYHFELILHLHVIVLLRNTLKSSKTTRRFGKKTLFEIDYVISITRNNIRTK